MNAQQLAVYEHVLQCIHDGAGGLFFLNGPGGTGRHLSIRLSVMLYMVKARLSYVLHLLGLHQSSYLRKLDKSY